MNTAQLRPARSLDAGAVGTILSDFVDETPWMPKLHSRAEDLAFSAKMITSGWVTVAAGPEVLGFLTLRNTDVLSLYVARNTRGQGVGQRLLAHAKDRCDHLRLWTFQANTRAQAFYRREGFVETQRSDGSTNDEGLPDIEFLWERSPAP